MKKVVASLLFSISVFSLNAQDLPKDLEAAVIAAESNSTENLVEIMMDYKGMQRIRLDEAYKERDGINTELDEMKLIAKRNVLLGGILAAASALFTGSYFLLHHMGYRAYENYLDATITSEAIAHRKRFQLFDALGYTGLALAGGGAGTSVVFFVRIPSQHDLTTKHEAIETEIEFLEGMLK